MKDKGQPGDQERGHQINPPNKSVTFFALQRMNFIAQCRLVSKASVPR
jgi:hypothetical protein